MTSKKCQSKANNNFEAVVKAENHQAGLQTPPLPQAPIPPSELVGSTSSQPPTIINLRPLRPDSASSTTSSTQPSLTITPLVSPKVSLPTEPEPPINLFTNTVTSEAAAVIGGGVPAAGSTQLLAAMAAGAMALTNPLLMNPLLMMQSLQQNSNDLNGLGDTDMLKNLKNLMQPPFPMMSLWPQSQFKKPAIAETFNGAFNESEVNNLRQLLETVNATVTKRYAQKYKGNFRLIILYFSVAIWKNGQN